jgi:uroporphyrin-III C-methyltransferase/precorrin-2 dehydrogenase/sirohydrochlorin ferrochelatase
MQTLPVFLDVKGKPCLLVGDGELALRKRRLLDKAGAIVIQVADQFTEESLNGVVLVIAASADNVLNQRVSIAATSRNIPSECC